MKLTNKEKIKVRKMTLTDKKKIEKALDLISYLLKRYRVDKLNLETEGSNYEAQVLAGMIKDLENMKKTLEE